MLKKKHIYLLLILLVCMISISAVSAADDSAKDIISADNNQELILEENINDGVLTENNDEEIILEENNNEAIIDSSSDKSKLKDENPPGSFTDLGDLINNEPTGVIILDRDYNAQDGDPAIGVLITANDVVVDGQGHTLDAKGKARFFRLADGVRNITFLNTNFVGVDTDENYGITLSSHVYAKHCTFKNNKGNSRLISDATFEDCTFENNYASYEGVISDSTAIDCRFIGNHVDNQGVMFGGSATNCNFTGNYASGSAGAMAGTTATNCIFENNYAASSGAVENCTATDCTFINNHADTGGAMTGGSAINCNFTRNYASEYGGAICNGEATDCIFEDNNANKDGGALYLSNAINCTFKNNEATGNGGAICHGNATDCSFSINSANNGSAIYDGNADGCNFTNNSASINGGAIYYGDATDCIFEHNDALFGGAIHSGDATNCNFITNIVRYENGKGGDGGAIYGGNAIGCTFTENMAGHDGGAIYSGTAKDSVFTENAAHDGGAIYNTDATNCTFISNNALNDGGANYGGNATNCTFISNNATHWGGAMYGDGKATKCVFINNTANEGEAMKDGISVLCIFENNDCDDTTGEFCHFESNDFTSSYNSGEKLIFKLTGDGQTFDGINTTINVYQNDELVGTFYALSGEDEGWVVDLAAGTYQAILSLERYSDVQDSDKITLTISKVSTAVSATDLDARYNEDKYLTVSLADDQGNPLGGLVVSVDLGGENNYTTDENGQISISTKGLPVNTYDASIIFAGNENYTGSNTTAKVTVEMADNNVVVDVENVSYGTPSIISITADGDGDYLVDVNGTSYNVTVKDGVGNVSVALDAGSYYANASFDNKNYNTVYQNADFTVDKADIDLAIIVFDEVYPHDVEGVINATMDGDYNLTVAGCSTVVTVKGNLAHFNLGTLDAGTYEAVVSFEGNNNYNPVSNKTAFNVTPSGTHFKVEAHPELLNYGETATITHIISDGATGNITYYLHNGTLLGVLSVGENLTLPVLDVGSYVIFANYSGDNDFDPAWDAELIGVNPALNSAHVTVANVTYGEKSLIEVSADVDGVYAVDVNGTLYNVTVKDGVGNVSVALDAGSYHAKASFDNKNYNTTYKDAAFTVNKAVTNLSAPDVNASYNTNKDLVITLKDSLENPLSGFVVSVDLNGAKNHTTDKNGQIKVPTKGLEPKSYDVSIAFAGDDNHIGSNAAAKVTINRCTPVVTVNANDVIYGDDAVIEFALADELNESLNGTLEVFVGGESYNVTLNDGACSLNLSGLGADKYTAVAFYRGDSNYNSAIGIDIFTVAKKASAIVYADMVTTAVQTGVDGRVGEYFNVTLVDADGNPLAGKAIQIGFNGKVYNRTTNETGGACLQINLPREDIYTFAICFLGDDNYTGSFEVAKITVNKQTAKLTVPNKSYRATASTKTLTATFKSAKGNALAKKKISFTVNGKTYTATTNSKGVATVKVSLNKKGTYSVVAKYAGDSTYAAISKKATLKLT